LSYLDSIYNMLQTYGQFGAFFPAVTTLYNNLIANTTAEIFSPAVLNLINTTFAPPDTFFMYAFMRNPVNTSQGFVQQFIALINSLPLTPAQRDLDLALMNNFVYVGPIIDNIDTYVNPGNIDVPLNLPQTNPPREFNQPLQIWNLIDYIAQVNFQQLYSHKLLNPATLLTQVGSTTAGLVQNIINTVFGGVVPNYYTVSTGEITNAIIVADNFETLTQNQVNYYEENKGLLNIQTLAISRPDYYFATYDDGDNDLIVDDNDDIRDRIEQRIFADYPVDTVPFPQYAHQDLSLMPNAFNSLNVFTPMDEVNYLANNYPAFAPPPEVSEFCQLFAQEPPANQNICNTLVTTAGEFPISPQSLYADLQNINMNYNGFAHYNDVITYLIDIIIKQSVFASLLFPITIAPTPQADHDAIIAVFELEIAKQEVVLVQKQQLVASIIQVQNRGAFGRFAWNHRLGSTLINAITLEINDQEIDKLYGDWINIRNELQVPVGQIRGLKHMGGDIPSMTDFNDIPKPAIRLYVPIPFWFCNYPGGNLPLVALNHSDIYLRMDLRALTDVSYSDKFTYFIQRSPTSKSGVIGTIKNMGDISQQLPITTRFMVQYIYLDEEERTRFAKAKHEYLIEQLQFDGGNEISPESFQPDGGFVRAVLAPHNCCKEFIWRLQLSKWVDGSLPNSQRQWFNYSKTPNLQGCPIASGVIRFNGVKRFSDREGRYFNYVQPYQHHTNTPGDGVQVYSFGLFPEEVQPSGAFNASKIDSITLDLFLDPDVKAEIEARTITAELRVYFVTVNLLRVMSGLAGVGYEWMKFGYA
jgi:hypothetical protein